MTFRPLYVSRRLLNGGNLVKHFLEQGLRSTLDPAEMHMTIVYSKKPMEWEKVLTADDEVVVPRMRGARGIGLDSVDRKMKKLGEHGVLVLAFEPVQSEELRGLVDRHHEYRAAGASHDYDEFRPHITVSYAGDGVDVSKIRPFPGELRFGPEIRKPIDTEWKPDMSKEQAIGKGRGTRTDPVVVTKPGQLDRACARMWDPTPGQADAGNYRKCHAIIGGLHVAIETPRGRMRHGAGKDGRPWSVHMPVPYGYFKRTEASDRDEVDVYVGPDAHRAAELPVWVMDQRDKDTREYDEPKTFLGFPDAGSARHAYLNAFSDGRAQDRIGGVVRMSFARFREWLGSGETKKPVAMRKSASFVGASPSYGPPTCDCDACKGKSSMTVPAARAETSATGTASGTASSLGKIMAFMSKGMSRLSPTERAEVLAEADLMAKSALGKASESLHAHENELKHVEQVEDLWDGPPDDHLEVGGGSGPGSEAKPGKVNIGPPQRASGDGAEHMERHYSRPTPQTGVQLSTERLGREVMAMRGAGKAMGETIKSIVTAMEAQGMKIDLMQSGTSGTGPDAAAVQKMIADAVAKALSPIGNDIRSLRKSIRTLRKADTETEDESDTESEDESGMEDEEEEEEEDEEAEQEESGSGTEIEIVNENEAEDESEAQSDEDEKAKSIQAAKFRLMAKCRVKWASKRLNKAMEHEEDGRHKKAHRFRRMGKSDLRRARSYLDAAKSLRAGRAGPSSVAIAKSIVRVAAKAKGKPHHKPAENQTTWPNKGEVGGYGKGQPPQVDAAALQKAADQLSKAVSGLGLLSTNMQGLMESVAGQSRNGNGLPPAVNLALAKGGDPVAKEAALSALADNSVISYDEFEQARDVMRLAKTPVPQDFITQKIALLHPAARKVITGEAA